MFLSIYFEKSAKLSLRKTDKTRLTNLLDLFSISWIYVQEGEGGGLSIKHMQVKHKLGIGNTRCQDSNEHFLGFLKCKLIFNQDIIY